MKRSILHQTKISLFCALLYFMTITALAQTATITVDATQNKRLISPLIYGRNESFDKSVQFYKDAGLRFARMNGGNNASGYNWRKRLSIHPDWYNNVYTNDWEALAQKVNDNFPNLQGMFAFQLLGRVASNNQNNFDDWSFNQSQYWSGHGQNLAGGGIPNESGGSKALVDGDMNLFSKPWPADSSVAILNYWFGPNGKGFNKNQFIYWSMDNEVDIWDGTHDWAMPTLISASAFMDRYIELAKKAKALYPGIKLCGPVTTSEWQWYKWSNESIYIDGRYYPWIEYFIKRLGDEYKATGIKLVDVLDIHNYPWYNGDDAAALQGHRIYYDETYDYPGSNGIRTSTGGWDPSLSKQYIFKRINDWLNEHFGSNHGITPGVSEWGTMSSSNANLESVIYASHLGTFANNGVELFSPWNWSIGMWETLHLFSRNAKKYSVSSTSSDENTVSAYSSVNENSDSLTVILVNRDMGASRTVTINLSNFDVANGNYNTLQLSSLPATETFISHTQNALKTNTVAVNANSLTITVPALSTTAILLTKAKSKSIRYVTLTNAATGMLMDGLHRSASESDAGQWRPSGSDAQRWSIDSVGGYLMLKNKATGLYLDGMGRTTNGQAAGQMTYTSNDAQQWLGVVSGNYVKFRNKATGMYLDGLGRTTDGDILGQWKRSNHNNQRWSLAVVETSTSARGTSFVIEANRESVPDESKFDSYPNPFVTEFTLDVRNSGEPFQIIIFDTSGMVLETITHSETAGPVSVGAALKPGLYLVRVNGVNWSQSFKVVKE
jgi:hypothetical protein